MIMSPLRIAFNYQPWYISGISFSQLFGTCQANQGFWLQAIEVRSGQQKTEHKFSGILRRGSWTWEANWRFSLENTQELWEGVGSRNHRVTLKKQRGLRSVPATCWPPRAQHLCIVTQRPSRRRKCPVGALQKYVLTFTHWEGETLDLTAYLVQSILGFFFFLSVCCLLRLREMNLTLIQALYARQKTLWSAHITHGLKRLYSTCLIIIFLCIKYI